MPTMTKRVNVRATVAVRNTNPPIYGTYKNIIMTTGDILKCLTKRATVDEILPDGSTIRLNYKNYYTDNGAGLDARGEIKIIKPKQPFVVKKATPTEPEKPIADISFNDTPMSNIDTKETVEKQAESPVVETTETHTESVILTTEDDSKEDTVVTDTEEKQVEIPDAETAVLNTEDDSKEDTTVIDTKTPAEEVTKTEKSISEQSEDPVAETAEYHAEDVKVENDSIEPVVETKLESNDAKKDNIKGEAPKTTPTAKKKSTTPKKKK